MKQQRYYQIAATEATRDGFKRGLNGVLVVMATGTGKTVLFVNWAKMTLSKGGRVLILVDRDVLVAQAADELREFGMYPVIECGDFHASPLSDLVVSSVQSMCKRLSKWNSNHFKLVITDEAHKSASRTFRMTLDNFKSAKHTGVTATPNRPDKKGLWNGYEEIVYEFPLRTRIEKDGNETLGAVEDGWLCKPDFKELPVPVTIDQGLATKKSLTLAEQEGIFDVDDYLTKAFKAAAQEVHGYKSLYFWNSCRNSKDAAAVFRAEGIEAMHVDGYLSKNKIIDIIGSKKENVTGWFNEAPKRVLCNCDLLGVGYNQPDIELIGLGRVYKSLTAYFQAIGRGTRVIAPVDDFDTKELRLNAIALSAKPTLRVIDNAIQNKEHNLATPACLVTDDPLEIEAIKKAKRAGKPMSFEEMQELVKALRASDGEKSRVKLAEDLANAAMRAKYKHGLLGDSAPSIHHILKREAKPHWKAPSNKAVSYLRKLGYNGEVPSGWHAHALITAYLEHKEKGKLIAT